MKGRLIVLEGIDGAGKTTQADRLEARLKADGAKVVRAREPGGTAIGERVRELLLDAKRSEMDSRTELFLYMASRAQLVAEVILPALERGETVLLDRYYYSTAAYQGAAGRVGIPEVLELAERIAKFPRPNRVILLDLDPNDGMARVKRPKDRIEQKGVDYMARVRAGFLKIAKSDDRFRVVKAAGTVDEVAEKVYANV